MKVAQIYSLVNNITQELLGKTDIISEDLSNVVDVGNEIFDNSTTDNYVRSLLNQIGRMIFVDRAYSGSAPSVLRDGWEYGSVLEKIRAEMPEATENESWELQNGASYDQDIFYKPTVSAKFFNKRVTFEIPMSFTERQVKESFQNATQLNAFMSMLYNTVDKAMTVKIDSLVMRTINNMTAETIYDDYKGAGLETKSGVKAVNLLYKYNQLHTSNTLTAENCITNPDFIRFAVYEIQKYIPRLRTMSSLFNIGKKNNFTPTDKLHVVMLADFKAGADIYLQSETFHDQYTTLPNAETVPFWQGSGTDYEFSSVSDIHVNTSTGNEVTASGILAVMFDRDALGVTNEDRRVTTHYNAKGEFYNNFYKFEAGYFNDLNENFVVFFVA